MYIAKQRIIGYIEYIVDAENPEQAIIEVKNISDKAGVMNSTMSLEYTDSITVSKLTEKELNDTIVKRTIAKLKHREEDNESVGIRKRVKRPKGRPPSSTIK